MTSNTYSSVEADQQPHFLPVTLLFTYSLPVTLLFTYSLPATLFPLLRFVELQLSLYDVLEPAITLAEEGFPVAPLTSIYWDSHSCDLANKHGGDMLLEGRVPKAGEIMRMPHLANTFRVSFIA